MGTPLDEQCPGCGVSLPVSDAPTHERYRASTGCLQLYSELSAYTLMRGDAGFIHQHALDAYAAQHIADQTRPIGAAFALIGLYLACERGSTGRQVQRLHMLLAQRSKAWPRFVPPEQAGTMTVLDVLRAPPGAERDAALMRWAQVVWAAWSQEHERVKTLFERVMAD
jgi:hypothetical protein